MKIRSTAYQFIRPWWFSGLTACSRLEAGSAGTATEANNS